MNKSEKILGSFYAIIVIMTIVTSKLINNESENIDSIRKLNIETWKI